jgi:hypothetical protein
MTRQELSASRAFTIGTTNVVVSEECAQERTFMSIINTSTGGQTISIAFGQEAVALSGIVLYPGGIYTESREAGFRMNQHNVCAISSVAGGTIAVIERVSMEYRGGA